MGNAELIFSKIENEGYTYIQEMIQNKQEENVFLDFKLKTDFKTPTLSTDDKKNYGKALSGFSNTSGGVIIWGVEAKMTHEKIDAACGEIPILNAKGFLTELNGLLNGALVPTNPGVKNIHIPLPGNDIGGFVVTYVPESNLPPHRAMLKLNQYFTRSGDNFVQMEHVHLEDMFGRRQKPELEIHYEVVSGSIYGGVEGKREFEFRINVGIRNIGKYIAKYPAIRIKSLSGLHGLHKQERYSMSGLPQLEQTHNDTKVNGYMFAGGYNDVIHPYTHLFVVPLEGRIAEKYLNGFEKLDNEENLHSISYNIFAEGCEPAKGSISITLKEIQTACGFLKIN
ncbi:TPA: ATP-binding protein [Bacillus toyonensis]|nr:ATP-binding protein [Bacillus toyonensis]